MTQNNPPKRHSIPRLTTPMLFTITFILIGVCFFPMATACKPVPTIHLEKTGPTYAIAGEEIAYIYLVSNEENQPLSDVTVTDDRCGPATYLSGDDNENNKLDRAEVWTLYCITIPEWTFPDPLTNSATATGTWGDQTAEDSDTYTLYPTIIYKDVLLYWEEKGVDYVDPDTVFTIQMSKDNQILDNTPLSESKPLHLWLSQGTYQFTEINLPAGYFPLCDTISFTTGETYPVLFFENGITFDLSVEKTGPKSCLPSDQITYRYNARNKGPASVIPVLLDDLCGSPVYTGGDSDADRRLDPTETWTYEASYSANAKPGSIITNTVVINDAEGARLCGPRWFGRDVNTSNNTASWSVTVLSSSNEPEEPQEPEEPENPDEPDEPQEPEEPEEPENPIEPLQTMVTTHHAHNDHYGDLAPIANANGPYNALLNQDITFNGSASTDPDGIIIHSTWTFGDGDTAEGTIATHHYTHPGTYQVTLTVTDNFGVSDTDITTAQITKQNTPPTHPLIAGPTNGTTHRDNTYIIGSFDEDHDELTYHIDWGDGTTYDTTPLPSGQHFVLTHRWSTPGTYKITVSASDSTSTSSSEHTVTIHDSLIADNIAIIVLAMLALIALLTAAYAPKKKQDD